jgi:hypothetical protein
MSLATRMEAKKNQEQVREAVRTKLYKNERTYRADKLVEAWSRIPEVGAGLKQLPLTEARNVAINLDRQAAYMSRLNEAQMSTAFNNFTPENMLRLVRLAMPNVIRNKIFTEFAMETARDSIKYVRPMFTKNSTVSNPIKGRDYDGFPSDELGNLDNKFDNPQRHLEDTFANDFNANDFRKALYETTEDRYVQEFWPAKGGPETFAFTDGPFGPNGEKYIDGFGVLYDTNEVTPVAIQDKRTKMWFISPDYEGITAVTSAPIPVLPGLTNQEPRGVTQGALTGSLGVNVTVTGNFVSQWSTTVEPEKRLAPEGTVVGLKLIGRYDSEDDFAGDYLGEVEIRMSDYEFKPRPTSIGVTWSQLSEIVLDTSFQISAEEYLVTYASQEIRVALDYRAIKIAYAAAKTNPRTYHVYFDAAYNTVGMPEVPTSAGTKEGYIHNAQTFMSVIDKVGDVMLNDINRGGVSRLVAGPAAGSYMRLIGGYSTKGKMSNIGAHQFGELEGIPLFKVPSSIIPNNDVLTVWKNDDNEADVSIAFGTLVPFFSTGIIQRKNFYKEAGLSTFGDWQILNRRYLALITIHNIKDGATN